MGLWNVKFDHKNGEQRVCKECGASFHTPKPRWRCNVCVNQAQKIVERNKRLMQKGLEDATEARRIRELETTDIKGIVLQENNQTDNSEDNSKGGNIKVIKI